MGIGRVVTSAGDGFINAVWDWKEFKNRNQKKVTSHAKPVLNLTENINVDATLCMYKIR